MKSRSHTSRPTANGAGAEINRRSLTRASPEHGSWHRPQHPNTLSRRMMESLAAICDTFLPAMDVSDTGDEALKEFYGTSASMAGATDHVGGLLCGGLKHPSIWLLRVALWCLSTWYGTFILCGTASVSGCFPYFQKFSKVERKKREEILLAWSLSSINLFRMLFKSIKCLVMRAYFTQVDDRGANPAWKAMDYCGPDPDFTNKGREILGPLHPAILHMDGPRELTSRRIQQAAFCTDATSSALIIHCDVCIVGSGSGGSVIAGVLAKAGYKVVVLEKGHYHQGSHLSLLEGQSASEMYEGGGLIATDDVGALLLAGSTVGGGSTINWSASIRTPDHVRREWCDDLGLEIFGSEAYDRALDVVCERMGVQSDVDREGFNNMVLRRGCTALGYPVADVPRNAPPDHYCGWCHLGCKDGKKKGAQETWLLDLVESGNGLVLPGCEALRILTRGMGRRAAHGVVVKSGYEEFVVESKATVVACGALNTPGLLKRSGLRNANIGKHLHVHPVVMAWGYFPPTTGGWPDESKKSYEGGILTSMSPSGGQGTLMQTPALHPGMFAAVTSWVSASDFRDRMTRFSRTAHLFALVRDEGSGTVDYPQSVAYRMDDADEGKLKRSLEAMVRVLAAAGAEEIGTQHSEGERVRVAGSGGGAAVERLVREVRKRGLRDGKTTVTSAHQMGSCRMGMDAMGGAVSPRGETWEVEGLYVADTSVFPTATGVNPMVTAQAIAYCTAQSVLGMLQGKPRHDMM